jgi:hypothetical protein
MGSIGNVISGVVTGLLETVDPIAAGVIGATDGLMNQNSGSAMSADTMSSVGSDVSSLMDIAELAAVFL